MFGGSFSAGSVTKILCSPLDSFTLEIICFNQHFGGSISTGSDVMSNTMERCKDNICGQLLARGWALGRLRGLGGGTLGQDLRLLTYPLGLQGERVVPGLPKFKFFLR